MASKRIAAPANPNKVQKSTTLPPQFGGHVGQGHRGKSGFGPNSGFVKGSTGGPRKK